MKQLNNREKRIVIGGAAIVAAVLLWRLLALLGGADARPGIDTRAGAIDVIESYARAERSLRVLAEDLGVRIPASDLISQETAIRSDLRDRARRHGIQVAGVRRIERSGRSRERTPTVQFRMEFSGQFAKLLELIHRLETGPIAYVVQDIQIGRPAGSRGGESGNGMVRGTMQLRGYLFPEPEAARRAREAEPHETPARAAADDAPATTTATTTTTTTAAAPVSTATTVTTPTEVP